MRTITKDENGYIQVVKTEISFYKKRKTTTTYDLENKRFKTYYGDWQPMTQQDIEFVEKYYVAKLNAENLVYKAVHKKTKEEFIVVGKDNVGTLIQLKDRQGFTRTSNRGFYDIYRPDGALLAE